MNYQTNTEYKPDLAIAKYTSRSIAFIDAEAIKKINLASSLNLETELIVIDSTKDGIEQITELLAERRHIKSLQIITSVKSKEDSLKIGSTQLNIHNLEAYRDDLQQWQNALSANAEILIYGCLVLVESIFQNFIHQLAKITKADIGAFVTFADSITANTHKIDRHSLMVAWKP